MSFALIEILLSTCSSRGAHIADYRVPQVSFLIKSTRMIDVFIYYLNEIHDNMHICHLPSFHTTTGWIVQILRHYHVLDYSPALSRIVDDREVLPAGHEMESEIRGSINFHEHKASYALVLESSYLLFLFFTLLSPPPIIL